tara:strand:- start:1245 stop:2942 length:1698 start_codon:yes stop_codon:yes gene_type:complete
MPSHYNSTNTSIGTATNRSANTGGGSVQLTVATNGTTYVKSRNPENKNIINNELICLESDFRQLVSFDTTGNGKSSSGGLHLSAVDCESLVICNEGEQTAEIVFSIPNFDNDDDLIGNNFTSRRINTVLRPNDFMYLPHNVLFTYDHDSAISTTSATDTASTATSGSTAKFIDADASTRGDGITRSASGIIETNVLINNASNHASGDTTLTVDSSHYFKVNDILRIAKNGGGTEFLKVVDIASSTTIDVERGILGSTAGQLDDNTEFNLVYKNQIGDSRVTSDLNGLYQASTFFGYGRSISSQPQGLTMGSIAIKVREPAYQEFGLTGQTVNTSTGLATSTSFDFKITNDADSQQTITIVTDSSNVNWGGTNGVLSKINDQFKTLYENNTFTNLPTIALVNGDVRVTSGSRLSTSSIALADGTSNNLIGGSAGRIPNVDIYISTATQFPKDFETDKIIFDDGKGNLNGGAGSGTIDYNSGAISLNTFPNSEFSVSAYFNSALSGDLNNSDNSGGSPANPRINSIVAKSTNPYRDANIRVIVYDPEMGDSRNFSESTKKSSRSGKR